MGMAMRAVSEDRDAAALMGIDSNKVIIFTFVLGACMAGIGGVLYCFVYKQIYFFTGFLPGIKASVLRSSAASAIFQALCSAAFS